MISGTEQSLYDQVRVTIEDAFKKKIIEKLNKEKNWADHIAILQLCDYDSSDSKKKIPDLRALVAYIQSAANHIVLHRYKITTSDTIVLQNIKETDIEKQIKVDLEDAFSIDQAGSAKDFYQFVENTAKTQGTFNIRYRKSKTN